MQDYPRDTDRFFLLLCPVEVHIYDSLRVNTDKPARSFVSFFLSISILSLSLSFVAVARVWTTYLTYTKFAKSLPRTNYIW